MTSQTSTTDTPAATERREFGRIFARKESRFLWVRFKVDGRTYEESTHSTSQKEAEKFLARRQAELGLGAFVAPDVRRTTFADLAAMLTDDYTANGRRSLARAKRSVAHLRAFLGDASRAVTITGDRVSRYVAARQAEGAAPATIRNELAALKRMFTLAIRAGKLVQRPHIPALHVDNARVGFFEELDFRALLAKLPESLRAPIEFAYLTGWRVPSEVLPLTWAQVDFEAGVVRLEVGTTKNGSGRVFPFAVLPPLEELLRGQHDRTMALERALGRVIPHVFHRTGRPIRSFAEAWRSACARAATVTHANGLTEIARPELLTRIPHDLRRTAVRNLVRAGVPERVAMALTGHKTRSVFDRYDIVNERDLSEGVEKLAAFLAGRGKTGPNGRASRGTEGGQLGVSAGGAR